jgi:hypothetical protein
MEQIGAVLMAVIALWMFNSTFESVSGSSRSGSYWRTKPGGVGDTTSRVILAIAVLALIVGPAAASG